tara:strand:- start:17 stop:565 length:549 start_codon:yes stop_codon:yes gene_type:complete
MSKKSRRRNKRLLALAGLAGAVALSSKRKRDANVEMDLPKSDMSNYENEGSLVPAKKSTRSTTSVVKTPTTVMDSMPARPKFNQKSKRIVPGTNKVFTIEGVKQGVEPKVGNSKSLFIGDDGSYTQGDRTFPNKMSYMNRDKKPAMLGLKSGGRAGLKSGGKVRGCGIAKRGLGRAMKKGKR